VLRASAVNGFSQFDSHDLQFHSRDYRRSSLEEQSSISSDKAGQI